MAGKLEEVWFGLNEDRRVAALEEVTDIAVALRPIRLDKVLGCRDFSEQRKLIPTSRGCPVARRTS